MNGTRDAKKTGLGDAGCGVARAGGSGRAPGYIVNAATGVATGRTRRGGSAWAAILV